MDWRDNQQWRKNIRRVDETETEFDLYFQGTVREITLRDRIRKTIQLLEGTPLNSKKYLGGEVSLETFVILEKIFSFVKDFDKKLDDPVWESVSLKIKKYIPFININVFQYKKILRELINE